MKFYEGPNIFDAHALGAGDCEHSTASGFFNQPGWYKLVAQHGLATGAQTVLAVDHSDQLALACCRTRGGRELRSCTNLYTCEFDLMGGRENTLAVRTFARDVVSLIWPLDYLRLEGLDPMAAHFTALLDGMRSAGFHVRPYLGWITRFEHTCGTDFDQYLSGRPSILRNTWRRKQTRLKGVSSTFYTSYERQKEEEDFIPVYQSVREGSWKGAEPFTAFVLELIRLAARMGALRFGILEIDGVPAAAQFWIVWSGKATIFKLVYAEQFSAFSPGTLLTMHMMEKALEFDKPVEINFGRGDDAYKKMWLSERRERWGIEAANPRSWRGLARCVWLRAGTIRHRIAAGNSVVSKAARDGGSRPRLT